MQGKAWIFLREHNITVDDKLVCSEECKSLNYVFFNYIKEKKPYVILKYAQSLDGKIATYRIVTVDNRGNSKK